jgi:hypothetical protein
MPTQVRFVTDSIVCVRRPSYLTCSYLVRTPTGVVVVDAGMDSGGPTCDVVWLLWMRRSIQFGESC